MSIWSKPTSLAAAIALAGPLALGPVASADVVTSDDILRIRFTVNNNFNPGPPNTMWMSFGIVNVLEPMTARIGELYDGDTLLGTASPNSFGNHTGPLSLSPSNSWTAPGSPFTFDMPATNVDFSTIHDGTIDGRIDWHPQTGSVDINLNNISLTFIIATSCCGGTVVSPPPTITSIEIVAPCPEDIDGSGAIDFGDILAILAAWGNVGGPEDIDGSGTVDFGDILRVLALWGACP